MEIVWLALGVVAAFSNCYSVPGLIGTLGAALILTIRVPTRSWIGNIAWGLTAIAIIRHIVVGATWAFYHFKN